MTCTLFFSSFRFALLLGFTPFSLSDFSLPLKEFEDALSLYQKATKKDMVAVLNRQGLNVAYRAAQFTGITKGSKIGQELRGNYPLACALTSLSLKRRGIGALPKGQFAAEVEKFIEARIKSSRYLRFGWAQAIVDLGGTYRGAKLARGSHGFGDKATALGLLTTIAWILDQPNEGKAESAEEEAFPALEKAMEYVIEDITNYAQEKMAKTSGEYSA